MAEEPQELTGEQVALLRDKLVALEGELRVAVEAAAEGARPVDLDEPIGRLSRMEAIQQKEMASANRATLQTRLRQTAAALKRIQSDEYGLCTACEEPIGFKRLVARPESPMCLGCQSARE